MICTTSFDVRGRSQTGHERDSESGAPHLVLFELFGNAGETGEPVGRNWCGLSPEKPEPAELRHRIQGLPLPTVTSVAPSPWTRELPSPRQPALLRSEQGSECLHPAKIRMEAKTLAYLRHPPPAKSSALFFPTVPGEARSLRERRAGTAPPRHRVRKGRFDECFHRRGSTQRAWRSATHLCMRRRPAHRPKTIQP